MEGDCLAVRKAAHELVALQFARTAGHAIFALAYITKDTTFND